MNGFFLGTCAGYHLEKNQYLFGNIEIREV